MESTRISVLLRVRDHADESAWTEFDSIYRPILRRYAKARGLRDADVDDVVQHCMTGLLTYLRGFAYDPSRGRFRGWLRTLVNNHIHNIMRRKRQIAGGLDTIEVATPAEDAPDAEFDRIWLQQHLRYCLAQLRPSLKAEQYDAFVAHVVEGAPVETVCQRFALNADQLYKLKWSVTQKLRKMMQEQFGEVDQ